MFKEQKFSKFITNNNYNFERERILEILPDDLLYDSFNTISNWENYHPTPLENLNKLSKRLSLKNRLGLKCKIFISDFVSKNRAREMEKFGAEIIKVKGNYDKSLQECKRVSKNNKWEIIQDVAWEGYELVPKLTMAGYSTMIKEISEQTNEYITHIFLQAGVGGMAAGIIAGVAKYFKKIPKIIVVEPENANCVMKSIENGALTNIKIEKESIMGCMSCGEVSLVPWKILKESVNNCMSVSDKFVSQTIAMLAN